MSKKAKNDNLLKFREKQQSTNTAIVLKAIEHIKSLDGVINFSTVSQVTFDIANPLNKEKGITLQGISKNKIYRTLVEKAKLSQNIDTNLKSNKSFYTNNSNSNITVADIKLQLHELRVKNANLKIENKILEDQLKTKKINVDSNGTIRENIVEKSNYFHDICSNLISRLLELEIAYINLDHSTLNVQVFDEVILNKEALEILYKDKLNELKNEKY